MNALPNKCFNIVLLKFESIRQITCCNANANFMVFAPFDDRKPLFGVVCRIDYISSLKLSTYSANLDILAMISFLHLDLMIGSHFSEWFAE